MIKKQDARLLLRKWRDENMRMSQDILELWESIVAQSINKFGDESKLNLIILILIIKF